MKGAPVTATLDEKCAVIRKNGLSGFSMVAMGWLARNTVTSVFARDIASISAWRLGWRDWKDLSLKTGRLPKSTDKKDGYKLYQWLISTKSKPQRLTDDQKKRFDAVLNRVGLLV